ncbi:MAG: flagellar biosynthesis protein FlhF [Nitrospirota bacterium]|nr:flagellar biosynthesis protein FlhF [Nitrospirota bacterium]
MKLKRFEALTLQEALGAVKAELGSEAVIISTRRINKAGKLFGLLSQPMVEVTAAVDRPARFVERDRKKAEEVQETKAQEKDSVSMTAERPWYEPPSDATPPPIPPFGEHLRVAALIDPVSQQIAALREDLQMLQTKNIDVDVFRSSLKQELDSLRSFVGETLADRGSSRLASLPKELHMYYDSLVGAGVSENLAYSLVRAVMETLGASGASHRETVADMLRERMEQVVPVSGPLVTPGTLQKVVMLVGPTGVGKTTTVAKLASQFTHGENRVKTVVVTLDTYRVAAVEQLRIYARILKVPVEVAVTPTELAACIGRHQDAGLILVDTAGRSPNDTAGREELLSISQQKIALETHLVLSTPTDSLVQEEVIRRYNTIPIHRLLLTKLDEARQFGAMFNLIHQTGLPVSYLAAGQRVPEDLEEATSKAIVDRINICAEKGVMARDNTLAEVGVA